MLVDHGQHHGPPGSEAVESARDIADIHAIEQEPVLAAYGRRLRIQTAHEEPRVLGCEVHGESLRGSAVLDGRLAYEIRLVLLAKNFGTQSGYRAPVGMSTLKNGRPASVRITLVAV